MRTTRSNQDLYARRRDEVQATGGTPYLGSRANCRDDVWDELVGLLARPAGGEPKVVVVAADLAQHDERLAQDLPLGA